MRTQHTYLILAALLLALIRHTLPAEAQTQLELNQEACTGLTQAEAELDSVYRQVLSAHTSDAVFTRSFQAAQEAWRSYRDLHVKSLYPAPNPSVAYGSVNPMCQCLALAQLTIQRTEEIKRIWIEGSEEGNVCIGSGKMRSQ